MMCFRRNPPSRVARRAKTRSGFHLFRDQAAGCADSLRALLFRLPQSRPSCSPPARKICPRNTPNTRKMSPRFRSVRSPPLSPFSCVSCLSWANKNASLPRVRRQECPRHWSCRFLGTVFFNDMNASIKCNRCPWDNCYRYLWVVPGRL